jgi:hypothetical protein
MVYSDRPALKQARPRIIRLTKLLIAKGLGLLLAGTQGHAGEAGPEGQPVCGVAYIVLLTS